MGFPYPRVCSKEGEALRSPAACHQLFQCLLQPCAGPRSWTRGAAESQPPATPWSWAKGRGSDSTSFRPHPHPKAPPTHDSSSWPHPSLTSSNSGFGFSNPPAWLYGYGEAHGSSTLVLPGSTVLNSSPPTISGLLSSPRRSFHLMGCWGNPGALLIGPLRSGCPECPSIPASPCLSTMLSPASRPLSAHSYCSAERHK